MLFRSTEVCSNVIYYNRTIVPKKYYIYTYNDYLAIFKSGDDCDLSIEDKETDVYMHGKKASNLREYDRERISNYEMFYDTKVAAEEAISELIS